MNVPTVCPSSVPQSGPLSLWPENALLGARPRILIAEDEPLTRYIEALVLRRAGCRVDLVSDGERAWAALCAQDYDLLITDNEMPGLSGLELVERARDAGMRLPVIVASGSAGTVDAQRLAGLNLAAIVHKPFGLADLTDTVRRTLIDGAENAGHSATAAALLHGKQSAWTPECNWGLNE